MPAGTLKGLESHIKGMGFILKKKKNITRRFSAESHNFLLEGTCRSCFADGR